MANTLDYGFSNRVRLKLDTVLINSWVPGATGCFEFELRLKARLKFNSRAAIYSADSKWLDGIGSYPLHVRRARRKCSSRTTLFFCSLCPVIDGNILRAAGGEIFPNI